MLLPSMCKYLIFMCTGQSRQTLLLLIRCGEKENARKRRAESKNGRDDWIRTSDLTHPKGARYQASLRPDRLEMIYRSLGDQGYHRPSRSVKKARSVSRRSSNIFRLRICGVSSAGGKPPPAPLSIPACSVRCRRAPSVVKPSSYSRRLILKTMSKSSCRYRRCPLGLFTGSSMGNSLSQ